MSKKLIQELEKTEQIIGQITKVTADVTVAISFIQKIVNRIKLRRAKRKAAKLRAQIEATKDDSSEAFV